MRNFRKTQSRTDKTLYEVSFIVQADRTIVEAGDEDSARRVAMKNGYFNRTHAMWEDGLVAIPARGLEDCEVEEYREV